MANTIKEFSGENKLDFHDVEKADVPLLKRAIEEGMELQEWTVNNEAALAEYHKTVDENPLFRDLVKTMLVGCEWGAKDLSKKLADAKWDIESKLEHMYEFSQLAEQVRDHNKNPDSNFRYMASDVPDVERLDLGRISYWEASRKFSLRKNLWDGVKGGVKRIIWFPVQVLAKGVLWVPAVGSALIHNMVSSFASQSAISKRWERRADSLAEKMYHVRTLPLASTLYGLLWKKGRENPKDQPEIEDYARAYKEQVDYYKTVLEIRDYFVGMQNRTIEEGEGLDLIFSGLSEELKGVYYDMTLLEALQSFVDNGVNAIKELSNFQKGRCEEFRRKLFLKAHTELLAAKGNKLAHEEIWKRLRSIGRDNEDAAVVLNRLQGVRPFENHDTQQLYREAGFHGSYEIGEAKGIDERPVGRENIRSVGRKVQKVAPMTGPSIAQQDRNEMIPTHENVLQQVRAGIVESENHEEIVESENMELMDVSDDQDLPSYLGDDHPPLGLNFPAAPQSMTASDMAVVERETTAEPLNGSVKKNTGVEAALSKEADESGVTKPLADVGYGSDEGLNKFVKVIREAIATLDKRISGLEEKILEARSKSTVSAAKGASKVESLPENRTLDPGQKENDDVLSQTDSQDTRRSDRTDSGNTVTLDEDIEVVFEDNPSKLVEEVPLDSYGKPIEKNDLLAISSDFRNPGLKNRKESNESNEEHLIAVDSWVRKNIQDDFIETEDHNREVSGVGHSEQEMQGSVKKVKFPEEEDDRPSNAIIYSDSIIDIASKEGMESFFKVVKTRMDRVKTQMDKLGREAKITLDLSRLRFIGDYDYKSDLLASLSELDLTGLNLSKRTNADESKEAGVQFANMEEVEEFFEVLAKTNGGIKELVIKKQGLTSIPKALSKLKLEMSDFRDNDISTLKAEEDDMEATKDSREALKHINLANNELEELPEKFLENHPNLESIWLTDNGLIKIPGIESFKKVKNLKRVELLGNGGLLGKAEKHNSRQIMEEYNDKASGAFKTYRIKREPKVGEVNGHPNVMMRQVLVNSYGIPSGNSTKLEKVLKEQQNPPKTMGFLAMFRKSTVAKTKTGQSPDGGNKTVKQRKTGGKTSVKAHRPKG